MELWSGTIGALVSAVLAALVAVFVVWRTNKYQGKQAAIARADAYVQSAKALREQKEILEKQFAFQIEESRLAESSRCIAEFMSAAEALHLSWLYLPDNTPEQLKLLSELNGRMSKSVFELKMLGEFALEPVALLQGWPMVLSGLAIKRASGKKGGDIAADAKEALQDACRALSYHLQNWNTRTDQEREQAFAELGRQQRACNEIVIRSADPA
ncbi:hypothetical protein ACFY5D_03565 [Paeniglutamicibacter sp. NPDC012692]|uniref:hypothetical protein n=1 Tax=Paeniglutamicibacter sp. NPDC012692 TaxID=3364388 RepID=UPI0036ACAC6F